VITAKFSNLLPAVNPPKIFSHIPADGKVSRPENVDIRKSNSVSAELLLVMYIYDLDLGGTR